MRRQHGLTLIELLVALTILAILVGVAFPGFQGMMARNNLATSANSLVLAINLARSEAVRISDTVNLTAVDPSDGDNEWGPGWQVAPPGGPLIRDFAGVPGGLTLNSNETGTTVQFDGRGALRGFADYEFFMCTDGGDGRRILVRATGRASVDDQTGAQCTP